MGRLATPVPRRRRLRAPTPRVPLSATHADFEPYGLYGVGETPGPVQTVAEKLAPGPAATKAAAHTPPPSKSGGTSGDLTIPGYQPETPTGTPYVPSEPGHSAQDFARAEAARRREEALRSLAPLAPPGSKGLTPIDRLAQAAGAAAADPLQALLHTAAAVESGPVTADKLLSQVAPVKTELRPIPHFDISAELKASQQAPAPPAPVRTVTLAQLEKRNGGSTPAFGAAVAKFTPAQQAALYEGKAIPVGGGASAAPNVSLQQASALAARVHKQFLGGKTEAQDTALARKFEQATGYQFSDFDIHGKPIAANLKGGAAAAPTKPNPADPLGAKTLGNVTLAQLQQAAKAGTLKIKDGTLSTPANRQILHQLLAAHQTALSSRQVASLGLSAYGPEAERNARIVLGVGAARDEPKRALLASLETGIQESGFENLPISGPGGGWRQEETAFYDPSTITNVKKGAENFFNELDEIPGKGAGGTVDALAQEVQGSGAGATYYAQHQAEAVEALKAYEQGQPDALAAKQLVQAKHAAAKAGINPTPWNGDVQGGGSDYVWIRGDAAGAVHWAKSTLGTQEGSPKQRHWAELEALGPSEPWCADWVAVNLARRGVELPEGPNGSWNYEDAGWKGGTQLGTDPSVAKPGDLVVYGGGAHIAMYVGNGKVIAGNWGDEVAEYGVSEDSRGISAIVRPHYKGGKVKVKAGQLPGSSSESTFDQGAGGGGSEGTEGGVAPAETVPASTQSHGQAAAAALANFGVPTAPSYAATVATPEINGEQTAAQELLALLTRRDLSVNRA